ARFHARRDVGERRLRPGGCEVHRIARASCAGPPCAAHNDAPRAPPAASPTGTVMRIRVVAGLTLLACLLPAARAQAAWVRNGDSLCTAIADQSNAVIVSDNAGGAVAVLRDQRK